MRAPPNKKLSNGLLVCWLIHQSVAVLFSWGVHAQDLRGNPLRQQFWRGDNMHSLQETAAERTNKAPIEPVPFGLTHRLNALGRILYGEHWVPAMARDLKIRQDAITNWLSGKRELPPDHPIFSALSWTDLRALKVLAKAGPLGVTEVLMLAHGFTTDMLVTLSMSTSRLRSRKPVKGTAKQSRSSAWGSRLPGVTL